MTTTADTEAFVAALRTPAAGPPAAGAPLPTWLWRLAAALYEQLPPSARDDWARRLQRRLRTRASSAGLRTLHTWHTRTVLPLLAETAQDDAPGVFKPLSDLHHAAAQGTPAARDTWRTALGPVLLRVYGAAYDRASAYAEAHVNARDYALANGFAPPEAEVYGHEYARLSSEANASAFGEAHAEALGSALAHAYAADEGRAYADTFPEAQLRAVIRAARPPAGDHDVPARDPSVCLSEGFLTALDPVHP